MLRNGLLGIAWVYILKVLYGMGCLGRGAYYAQAPTCGHARAQTLSATDWTALGHIRHMAKGVIRFVFKMVFGMDELHI